MFNIDDYLMGRDKIAPNEWTVSKANDACILLQRVNDLLESLGYKQGTLQISSGFRTQDINKAAGGAPNSGHCLGKAIDIKDSGGTLKRQINKAILEQFDLYMEAPLHTPTWCHLDITPRVNRIFIP